MEFSNGKSNFLKVILVVIITVTVAQEPGKVEEYCEGESFAASCKDNEIILMESAFYGRMELGGCLKTDYGNLGCKVNVLEHMDRLCSGRRTCNVRVSLVADIVNNGDVKACPGDLRGYLVASYKCVPVMTSMSTDCNAQPGPLILDQEHGFIANVISKETGCGSIDSPWMIRAEPGKIIKIKLYDFSVSMRKDQTGLTSCQVYASVKEPGPKISETICGTDMRKTIVYRSVTNVLELRIVTGRNNDDDKYFAFEYEVSGCADLNAPKGGHVQRVKDTALMKCNKSNTAWKMICKNNVWTGTPKNCTGAAALSADGNTSFWRFLNGTHEYAVAVVVAIAFTVGLLIVVIGIVCFRRRYSHARRNNYREPYGVSEVKIPSYESNTLPANRSKGVYCDTYCSNENDYYRTWQIQRHCGQTQGACHLPGTPHASHQFGFMPSEASGAQGEAGTSRRKGCYSEHIYESPKFERKEFLCAEEPRNKKSDCQEVDLMLSCDSTPNNNVTFIMPKSST